MKQTVEIAGKSWPRTLIENQLSALRRTVAAASPVPVAAPRGVVLALFLPTLTVRPSAILGQIEKATTPDGAWGAGKNG